MRRLPPTTVGLALLSVFAGCDATDYYPHHRPPEPTSDYRKGGPGTYGGNNSEYPVGTPGTTGAERTAPKPADATNPSLNTAPGATGIQINPGVGTFPPTDSYSGRATGESGAGDSHSVPINGTTNLGTSGGH